MEAYVCPLNPVQIQTKYVNESYFRNETNRLTISLPLETWAYYHSGNNFEGKQSVMLKQPIRPTPTNPNMKDICHSGD